MGHRPNPRPKKASPARKKWDSLLLHRRGGGGEDHGARRRDHHRGRRGRDPEAPGTAPSLPPSSPLQTPKVAAPAVQCRIQGFVTTSHDTETFFVPKAEFSFCPPPEDKIGVGGKHIFLLDCGTFFVFPDIKYFLNTVGFFCIFLCRSMLHPSLVQWAPPPPPDSGSKPHTQWGAWPRGACQGDPRRDVAVGARPAPGLTGSSKPHRWFGGSNFTPHLQSNGQRQLTDFFCKKYINTNNLHE